MAGNHNSGRGNGTNKDKLYVASLARDYTQDAIKKLVDVMNKGDDADAVRAASTLLDRGWGKAPQEVRLGNADEEGLKILVEVVNAATAGG